MVVAEDLENALAASDLVIGSAGAISLAEITALGKPSIIIPKAYTAENHQEYNAKSIEKQGAGVAILEKNLTDVSLNDAVTRLLGNREELLEMANKSKEIGKPEAIDLIYDEILKIYNANNKEKLHKKESKKSKKEENTDTNVDLDKKEDTSSQGKVIGIKKK